MSTQSENLNAVREWIQSQTDTYTYDSGCEDHGYSWRDGSFNLRLPFDVAVKGVDASRVYLMEQRLSSAKASAEFYASFVISLERQLDALKNQPRL